MHQTGIAIGEVRLAPVWNALESAWKGGFLNPMGIGKSAGIETGVIYFKMSFAAVCQPLPSCNWKSSVSSPVTVEEVTG